MTMTDPRITAIQYAHDQRARFLVELKDFCTIPSISTDPTVKPEMQRAAEWVANQLRNIGLQNVQVLPTAGHPVVYAESLGAPGKPTLLIYGHYDVQPPDPLDLWKSGPFEPDERGEHLFARGVTDMKGQVLAAIKAVESIIRTGELPINVKFLIEGEEEIGSPSLDAFLDRNRELLACDLVLNPDAGILGPDTPTIAYGLRGLAYFELRIYGPDHDLHSGVFGGAVHNPAQVLCELIAGMHDDQGRITLPGFFDAVRPLDAEERAELARLPITEASVLTQTGAPALWGEAGYTTVERMGARPTLEVHGLLSGFTGAGTKTVLPAWAMAKISCRLVPDQDPEEVYQQFVSYLQTHAPATIRWEVSKYAGSRASVSTRSSSGIQAYSQAMETVWGKRPVFKREGGSVPVVTQFKKYLGVESINTGFSMPGDNMHSPNEMLHLPTLWKGLDAFIHFFFNLAQ
jgi:acetylornithine deacetylase/succinyl-diaminopimelate desuccinylase-like protein